jgi:hypothetical protein
MLGSHSTSDVSNNYWRYPEQDGLPPLGINCLLLTLGGTVTIGQWVADGFLAWSPFPIRIQANEPTPYYAMYGTPSDY